MQAKKSGCLRLRDFKKLSWRAWSPNWTKVGSTVYPSEVNGIHRAYESEETPNANTDQTLSPPPPSFTTSSPSQKKKKKRDSPDFALLFNLLLSQSFNSKPLELAFRDRRDAAR